MHQLAGAFSLLHKALVIPFILGRIERLAARVSGSRSIGLETIAAVQNQP